MNTETHEHIHMYTQMCTYTLTHLHTDEHSHTYKHLDKCLHTDEHIYTMGRRHHQFRDLHLNFAWQLFRTCSTNSDLPSFCGQNLSHFRENTQDHQMRTSSGLAPQTLPVPLPLCKPGFLIQPLFSTERLVLTSCCGFSSCPTLFLMGTKSINLSI